jgi:hypothetical protein
MIGPEGQGKSTLTLALTYAGARFLTDDTIPIDPALPTLVRPGVQPVGILHPAIGHFGADFRLSTNQSQHLLGLADTQLMTHRVPLGAIYLINLVAPAADQAPVRRVRLSELDAAIAIVKHTKLGPLLGKSEGALLFDRAVSVAQSVPVYEMFMVRDMEQIDAAVNRILLWHDERRNG